MHGLDWVLKECNSIQKPSNGENVCGYQYFFKRISYYETRKKDFPFHNFICWSLEKKTL